MTEFVLRLHPQRRTVYAGHVVFAPDQVPRVAAVLDKWWETVNEKEAIIGALTRGPDGNVRLCSLYPQILFPIFRSSQAGCHLNPLLQWIRGRGSTGLQSIF